MKILIPHIGYTVCVKQKNKSQRFSAWVIKDSSNQCSLYIKQPIAENEIPTLAHELVHVLQYIAESRNIDMIQEQEHMGYLMGYLMQKILGYEYDV